MDKLHDILINQLKRENINPDLIDLDDQWQKVLRIVSSTYKDYDDYRYAMERSLDIASEEINKVNSKYQQETNKLNSLHQDSIIIVDNNWTIKSLNVNALRAFGKEGEDLNGRALTELFIFYNSKKQIIDFEKLKLHFECGASYVCPKGALICVGKDENELLVRYYIKPIYQDSKLQEFAIIIEDIGSDFIEQLDSLIKFNKVNLSLLMKQKQIETITEQFISSNHLMMMTQELLRYENSAELENIQRFLINTLNSKVINNDFSLPNSQTHRESQQYGFFYDRLSESLHEGLKHIVNNQNLEIESELNLKIFEDEHVFGGFIYDLTGELMKLFFTSDISKIKIHSITTIEAMASKIIVSYTLGQERALPEHVVNLKLESLKQHQSNSYVDYYTNINAQGVLQIDFILNFKTQLTHQEVGIKPLFPLKCLVFEIMDSGLSGTLKEHRFFDLFQCQTTSSLDNAVQLIKEARLDGDEFDVIISNTDNLHDLNFKVISEVASYLTKSFIGVIDVGTSKEKNPFPNTVPLIKVRKDVWLNELRSILYKSSIARSLLDYQEKQLPELSCQKQSIQLFDFENATMITYLYMLHYLGYQTYPQWKHHEPTQKVSDLILINLNVLTKEVYQNIAAIVREAKTPILICIPCLDDAYISDLLSLGISDYLVKPFTVNELVATINRLTRNSTNE